MKSKVHIPAEEYGERVQRAATLIEAAGYDMLIANSNEADFANVRYFSGFWPLFEVGGVAIAPSGKAALMCGPESQEFAGRWSPMTNIHRMAAYRESADPAFPGAAFSTFADVADSLGVANPKRIGLAGWLVTSVDLYQAIQVRPLGVGGAGDVARGQLAVALLGQRLGIPLSHRGRPYGGPPYP